MNTLQAMVAKNYPRNYFVALSLAKDQTCYKKIYVYDGHYLLHRKSGNLQFVYEHGSYDKVKEQLKSMTFNELIGPASICEPLELKIRKKGAFIAMLKKADYQPVPFHARPMTLDDLGDVVHLYSNTFKGYPKVPYMRDKLLNHRGLGYVIEKEKIIAVAQSDFYELIVGVATDPEFQHQGYATDCMHAIIQKVFETKEAVYLQYDDDNAGKLYEKLGFKVIDQVMHYER